MHQARVLSPVECFLLPQQIMGTPRPPSSDEAERLRYFYHKKA